MRLLNYNLFGESHGKAIGVVIRGVPPGIEVREGELTAELERRKGIRRFATKRKEEDRPVILSGVFRGHTTGTPIAVVVENRDVESSYYEEIKDTPRPGHGDYPARIKYFGYNDYRGGGHLSGRLTVGIVVAGYFAKKILERFGIEVRAYIKRIGPVEARELSVEEVFSSENPYCPDEEAFGEMREVMEDARKSGDSVGGIVEAVARNVPAGLGGPYEEDIEADLASAFFRIPAVKGVEFGLGFRFGELRGSEANDPFIIRNGKVVTETNNHGGFLGGMTTGMPIVARVVIKPTPSIYLPQRTVNIGEMREEWIRLRGRFDSCIVPKALPVVEGAMAIVLADHLLRRMAWVGFENAR
ncbi:Chorismate synthase [Thermococcus onnurineus NA1]|uniref:Chorismate synthase n=1 Tax=Thermococcus onnurineus (strain NA1) TaxID=523850 RepID=B6YX14_THEON|nr:chorismate synthase [Thermococcus onnurineus]ACJ16627.1 Chorismate synthase [Thermococcus onnurineus NA1]